MANASTTPVAVPTRHGWRVPVVILLCGYPISVRQHSPAVA